MFQHQAKRALQLAAPLLMVAAITNAQNFAIDWHTMDGGGATVTTGGTWELSGTIGQPDAGAMTGGTWELSGGFWPGAAASTSVPGDSDGDGDVDLDDYANLAACLGGPGVGLDPACDEFDSDGDGDVDLYEFAQFQTFFTGPLP